jgi:hypothetical protein
LSVAGTTLYRFAMSQAEEQSLLARMRAASLADNARSAC